jgi:hypothetical protein
MMGARIKYQLTVAYDAATKDEPKPIAFHKSAFAYPFELQSRREGLRLYRDHGNGVWEVIEEDDDDECGFAIFDDPPIPVEVGNAGKFNQEFVTLQPGENWTHEGCGQDPSRAFHPDEGLKVGDKVQISLEGSQLRLVGLGYEGGSPGYRGQVTLLGQRRPTGAEG